MYVLVLLIKYNNYTIGKGEKELCMEHVFNVRVLVENLH